MKEWKSTKLSVCVVIPVYKQTRESKQCETKLVESMLDRLNAQQTTESALAAVIYFLTDASEEFRKMVDVLILMVHPDLAGVVSTPKAQPPKKPLKKPGDRFSCGLGKSQLKTRFASQLWLSDH